MTEDELIKKLNKLQDKLKKAKIKRDLVKVISIQAEMQGLKREFIATEHTTMGNALERLPQDEKNALFREIQRIQIAADFLDGLIVDFRYSVAKVDKDLQAVFLDKVEESAKQISNFIKVTIDDFGNDNFSDDFGELADRLRIVIMNEIYKHEAIILKKQKEYEKKDAV